MALTPEEEERLWHTVFGNGAPGLVGEVRTIRRTLYRNPDTGEAGLVRDVADIKKMVIQIRAAWWIIGAVIVVVQFLQVLGVIGK